ncbi:MvdC/MvdD family ATP grasp protein [Streptomyces sp. NPDC052051]|uniref:MvdC/MvdD family ATP grasp protein n=1 Tax=Streptomyces sp. NPDC052051 TaxID=3154649 RepID=UPI00343C826D
MDDGRSVLVLTNPYDVTADVVLRLLAERRVPVARVDPGADLHTVASLTATYRTGDQRGTLRTASRELDTTRIRSVWVRRPTPYEGPQGLSDQDRRFAAEQALPIAHAVVAYLAELRLIFGAFDFVVTTAGDWHFLECNPNGQWAWQPTETTTAIAHAIADELERGPDT